MPRRDDTQEVLEQDEAAPVFQAPEGDPDFEITEAIPERVNPAMTPEPAPRRVTPPPVPLRPEVEADDEKSVATTLITMIKNVFKGTPIPGMGQRVAVPPKPTVYPVEQTFDSVIDDATAAQVREAVARIERGEEPFDD